MKKIWKTILCLMLAMTLCAGGSTLAFAAEAGESAEGDVSLEDLLSLLSALSGDEEGEGEAAPGETAVYATGPVSFEVPASWSAEESEDELSFYSNDFTEFTTAMLQEGSGEEIDITKEENVEVLVESLGGEDMINSLAYITVCGLPALWIDMTVEEEGLSVATNALMVQLDNALFSLAVMSLGSAGGYADFIRIVDSIQIEGASGETDYSAISDNAVEDSAIQLNTSSAAPEILSGEEITLIDDENVTVTIKDFQEDDWYALTAKVFNDNKTDKNLYYSFDKVSVNGYLCDPWWGNTVSAGHKSNEDLHFYQDDFDLNGIEQVREIELTLIVRDDDDWFSDPIVEQTFVIYPFGEDVPAQEPQSFDDGALLLADGEDFTMILKNFETDDYYFKGNVYLENNTDVNLEFRVSGSTAVNGYEVNPYFYKTVPAGKKANTSINWYLNDLTDNDIYDVEDLELDINIQDADDWYADPLFNDVIYVQVQ